MAREKSTSHRALVVAMTIALLPAVASADPVAPQSLPDPHLTPGATVAATATDICRPGYARSVRHVTRRTEARVFHEYGLRRGDGAKYEVDHLISLELGGSNAIQNLWPQRADTHPWNSHLKDRLENRLHALVCSGALSLQRAQRAIAVNWIAAYRQYLGAPR